METKKNKDWTIEEIKNLLLTNNLFICKATVKIFEKQTEDEQQTDGTSYSNGIGFNGVDAFIMSRFAKFYMEKGYLTTKQLAIAKRKIQKYAKQLTSIANVNVNAEYSEAAHHARIEAMEQG